MAAKALTTIDVFFIVKNLIFTVWVVVTVVIFL